MLSQNSSNLSNSTNQKNDVVNPRILLKDGFRPLGVNPTRRKKISQLSIVMDENQRSEILTEAMKLQEEKNGSGQTKVMMDESTKYKADKVGSEMGGFDGIDGENDGRDKGRSAIEERESNGEKIGVITNGRTKVDLVSSDGLKQYTQNTEYMERADGGLVDANKSSEYPFQNNSQGVNKNIAVKE